jgi:hypothetical protein
VFFFSADALLRKIERSNVPVDTRVSELDCMDFSSVNGFSSITSENHWQLVSMLSAAECRTGTATGSEILV